MVFGEALELEQVAKCLESFNRNLRKDVDGSDSRQTCLAVFNAYFAATSLRNTL